MVRGRFDGYAPPTMKRGSSAQAEPSLDGLAGRRRRAGANAPSRGRAGDTDDLVRIVTVLADDVETLDSMIKRHRPRLERAARGASSDRELALDQWTRIRARAVEVVNRAHDTLEKVKLHPAD
jgi:hypothetical protein